MLLRLTLFQEGHYSGGTQDIIIPKVIVKLNRSLIIILMYYSSYVLIPKYPWER